MKTYTFAVKNRFVSTFGLAALLVVSLASTNLAFCGPIHDAASKGDVNKVKALLQGDPKLVSSKDKLGNTPLHLAAFHGQTAAAQALIDAGADVNAKNNYGPYTPGDLWQVLSSNNHQDPVTLLQLHGVDARDMANGYTPLDLAIFASRHKDVVNLLLAKGADVNAKASSGATPLFWAVMRDQKDDVKLLLDKGANINSPDAYGTTILDLSLVLDWEGLVPILIDRGADVNAQDQSGKRPLTYALGMQNHNSADLLKKKGAHE